MDNIGYNKPNADILAGIKEGHRQAFDTFCRVHYQPLLSYGSIFLPKDIVKDIVQDTFLNLWINRTKIIRDNCEDLNAWLLKCVYNRCMNVFRHNKKISMYDDYVKTRMVSVMSVYLDPDNNPTLVNIFTSELRSSLNSAISALPTKCRVVFRMCYIEGMPEREVSEKLGLSVRTVENHIRNALIRLREILAKGK